MMIKSIVLANVAACASAFYLPGVAPLEYDVGAPVAVKVNKLFSMQTQLPYQFYTLPVCKPVDAEYKSENLGEILKGDEIMSSPYEVHMQQDFTCKKVCSVKLTEEHSDLYTQFEQKKFN